MNAWMLLIGLSAVDPNPAIPAVHFARESECRAVATAIRQQSIAAGSQLHAVCEEIEFVNINPDGTVTPKARS
ncbi:hypothetical protein D3C76_250630 [compost metagenome]